MKLHTPVVALVLAAAGVFAPVGTARAAEAVPFKGTLEGDVVVTPVDPPDVVDVLVVATGSSTQLGKYAVSVPHRVTRKPTGGEAEGYYEFVAANGDLLVAEFTGLAMVVAPGVLYIVETATIDPEKSTGRFAGATGEFTTERLFDTDEGTTVGYFEGTITLSPRR